MGVRPRSIPRPVEEAFRFLNGNIVDRSVALLHQAIGIKLPILIS
jgi:hypothetical protein